MFVLLRRPSGWLKTMSFALAAGLALVLGGSPGPTGLGSPAQAQAASAADEVVARVDGIDIRRSDVMGAIAELGPRYANVPAQALFKAMTEKLIDSALAAKSARAMSLHKSDVVVARLKRIESQVLEQAYYGKVVDRKVTDAALQRRYERDRDQLAGGKQVHARHILVKTRKEAEEIIAKLGRGEDFAALAKSHSIGPSKSSGGDLGFFKRGQMVSEFETAAFALSKGEVSRAPVQTQFGWHVIKVEDIRDAAPPPFADVADQLRQQMADEVVEAEIERLRKDADIELIAPDLKAEPAAPAPTPGR